MKYLVRFEVHDGGSKMIVESEIGILIAPPKRDASHPFRTQPHAATGDIPCRSAGAEPPSDGSPTRKPDASDAAPIPGDGGCAVEWLGLLRPQ